MNSSSPIEDQRPFVDNAFRPGKGSRPRPLAVSKAELGRRLDAIFKWSKKRKSNLSKAQVKDAMRCLTTMNRIHHKWSSRKRRSAKR